MTHEGSSRGGRIFGPASARTGGAIAIALKAGAVALAAGLVASCAPPSGEAPESSPAVAAARVQGDHPAASPEVLQRGAALYQQACIACHGGDLRGGIGFNLVDGDWVHGGSREAILRSISDGFPAAGMAGFGDVYSDEELSDLVDFILSRREGWEEVRYTLWPVPAGAGGNGGFDFAALADREPARSGQFEPALADFAIEGFDDYAVVMEGVVRIPGEAPAGIWVRGGEFTTIEIRVDDRRIEPVEHFAGLLFPVPRGRHALTISYATPGTPEWFSRDLAIIVLNPDIGAREFPLSTEGFLFLNDTTFEVSAEARPRVIRRSVQNLPPSTISVGLPAGVNYGFNTRSCAIAGVWSGGFLDIGPNIDGRGQSPAFPLGDWAFHAPGAIAFEASDGSAPACRYERTSLRADGVPVFHFTLDGAAHSLVGQSANNGLEFIYETRSGPPPSVSLPEMRGFSARIEEGEGQAALKVVLERKEAP